MSQKVSGVLRYGPRTRSRSTMDMGKRFRTKYTGHHEAGEARIDYLDDVENAWSVVWDKDPAMRTNE